LGVDGGEVLVEGGVTPESGRPDGAGSRADCGVLPRSIEDHDMTGGPWEDALTWFLVG
jgi:hypothetical protein